METKNNNNLTCFNLQQLSEIVTQNEDLNSIQSDQEVFIMVWLPEDRSILKTYLGNKQVKLKNLIFSCGDNQTSNTKIFEIEQEAQSKEEILKRKAQFLLEVNIEFELRVWLKQGDSLEYLISKSQQEEEEEEVCYLKSLEKMISLIKILKSAKSLNFILSTNKLPQENEQKQLVQLFTQVNQNCKLSDSMVCMLAEDFSLKNFKENLQAIQVTSQEIQEQSIEQDELKNFIENKDCFSFLNLSFYEDEKNLLLELLCGYSNQSVHYMAFWRCFLVNHTNETFKLFFSCLEQIKQKIENLLKCQKYCEIEVILEQLFNLKQKLKLKCVQTTFENIIIILINQSLYQKYQEILLEFQQEDRNLTIKQESIISQTFQHFCWIEKIKKYFDINLEYVRFTTVLFDFERILQSQSRIKLRYFYNNSCIILSLDLCICQYKKYLSEQQSDSFNCQQNSERQLNYFSYHQLFYEKIQRIIKKLKFFLFNQDYTLIDVESIQILGQFANLNSEYECEINVFYHEFIQQLKEKINIYIRFIEEYNVSCFTDGSGCIQILINLYQIFTNKVIFCQYLNYSVEYEQILLEKIIQFLTKWFINTNIKQIDLLVLFIKFAKLTNQLRLNLNSKQLKIDFFYEERIITIYESSFEEINQLWKLLLDQNCTFEIIEQVKIQNINLYLLLIDLIIDLQQNSSGQRIFILEEWHIRLNSFVIRNIQLCKKYINQISGQTQDIDAIIEKVCFYRSYFRRLIQILSLNQQNSFEIQQILYLIDQKLYFIIKYLLQCQQIQFNLISLQENSQEIFQRFSQYKSSNLLFEREIMQFITWRCSNSYEEIYEENEINQRNCSLEQGDQVCLQNKCNENTLLNICKSYEQSKILNKNCFSGWQKICRLVTQYSQSFIKILLLNKIKVSLIFIIFYFIFATIQMQKAYHQSQYQNEFYNTEPFQDNVEQKQAQRDQFGNLVSSSFDLAKDNQFNSFSLLIGQFYYEYDFNLEKFVIPAIKEKGIKNYRIVSDEQQFINELPSFDQAWIISGYQFANKQVKISDFIEAVLNHLSKQKGLALWSDNRPFFEHANIILDQISIGYENNTPIKIQLYGYFRAQEILRKGQNNKTQEFGFHLLTTGLETLYEGNTICAPQITSNTNPQNYGYLEIIGTSSHNLPAFMSLPGTNKRGRIVIDCGFTKLFGRFWFKTAGTQRYVKNLYAWLFWREKLTK